MRSSLESIVTLPSLRSGEDRASLWRHWVTSLAKATTQQRPLPLEGLHPDRLLAAVRVALEARLLDDLSWLDGAARAGALYELASATPAGPEKRELDRRVLELLYGGDAATFTALAVSLAVESRRMLFDPAIRARVALAIELPVGSRAAADRLALALVSRRTSCQAWLVEPSAASLPARRLAARLLERAAWEAALRAQQGDAGGLQVFEEPAVVSAWSRLLQDRESLVWRHVAVARGLLSRAIPVFEEDIDRELATELTPFEWRRGAVSLAAMLAIQGQPVLSRCLTLLNGPVLRQDAAVAAAMVHGLTRAAEVEPQAAEALLEDIVEVGGLDAAEALVGLSRETYGSHYGAAARARAAELLKKGSAQGSTHDDGKAALSAYLIRALAPDTQEPQPTLRDRVDAALLAFAEKDAPSAHRLAVEILESAKTGIADLEQASPETSEGRRMAFERLHDLDLALLESAALGNLLALGDGQWGGSDTSELGELYEHLSQWLIGNEYEAIAKVGPVPHLTLRLRRLRSLLHLVDADGRTVDDSTQRRQARRLRAARLLLMRVRRDAPSPLRRVICAALARACEALIRDEVIELSDVLVAIADHVQDPRDFGILAEACMLPELEVALRAYEKLTQLLQQSLAAEAKARGALDTIRQLAQALPWASTFRVTALRAALLQLVHDLEAVAQATTLQQLIGDAEATPARRLEVSVHHIAQLTAGARRRFAGTETDTPACGSLLHDLGLELDHVIQTRALGLDAGPACASVDTCLTATERALHAELPHAIANAIGVMLQRVRQLAQNEEAAKIPSWLAPAPQPPKLPAWMPPNRTIGGFYVLRPMAAGGVGSVFVVKRIEERHDEGGALLALKVPDYSAAAARTLSEPEFLRLFREEAGALLAVPAHPNLASFVTFDAGARPKPILVMELVEGPTLERVIERGDLNVPRALELIDGIAAGLSAMHQVGVGHLDVKPSNVILRQQQGHAAGRYTPVLVDFGLAGSHLRPGCATANYGAPEVWGESAADTAPTPMAADTYALACLAFEMLTGRVLFDGPHEMSMIHQHLEHDGYPQRLLELRQDARLAAVCKVLARALRQHPAQRSSVEQLRQGLQALAQPLGELVWPIG